jgi:hypothetical protein
MKKSLVKFFGFLFVFSMFSDSLPLSHEGQVKFSGLIVLCSIAKWFKVIN